MKEIITKVIIAVLVIAVIGGGAAFLLKSDDPAGPEQSTSSAPAGDTQTTSQPGSNEGSTDNAVNGTTANQSPSENVQGSTAPQGTDAPQSSQPQQGVQPSQSQQGVQPSQSQQSTQPSGSQQSTQPQQDVQPSQSQQSTQPQQVYKVDYYQDIFRSGKFLMKVNDPDLGEVVMAMSGNKMLVEASMEGMTLKMLYDGDKPDEKNPANGTWYIVIDKIKKYSPMPADMLGDMNVEELTKDFAKSDSNSVYTTGYETVNGEQLYCESCTDTNGNTTKYYFRGDQLIRSDSVSPSGEISTTEFKEINPNVDDSLFVIPSGYAKWDISWLLNMAAS